MDKERKITPARAVKDKKKYKLIYTDHFSTVVTFEDLPRKQLKKEENIKVWNLSKEDGWKNYKTVSDQYSDVIKNLVNNDKLSLEEAYEKFDKIHNSIKFKSFGKVTINKKKVGKV